MTAVGIREATADDVAAIVALLADDPLGATREDPGEPLNPRYSDAFSAIDGDPNNVLFVAVDDGAVIGCLQLTIMPGLSLTGMWRAQIEAVRVARSARGSGVGHRLVEEAITRARARECGLVQLTTDKTRPDAHRFYEDLGFVASHVGMKLRL